MHLTQPLKWQEYCPNKNVRKLMTMDEILQAQVDREAAAIAALTEHEAPLLEDKRKHPMQMTEVFKRAFSADMVRSMLP